MKAHDISFTINSGDHKGEKYGFTLMGINNRKAWEVTRLSYSPPSMVKEKIKMVLAVREQNIPLSGAVELKQVNKILDQLETIADASKAVTLKGIDNEERPVRVDRSGFSVEPVVYETGKDPEYGVNLIVWGLYE